MNTTVTVQKSADVKAYEAHITALSAKAALLSSHTVGPNRFTALESQDTFLYSYFVPGRGEIRTVTEPLSIHTALPPSTPPKNGGTTALYQLDLDNRRIDCGMSYVFHMADGRFFLLDGGYFTHRECDRLYALLRACQPVGKLIVAGWFFSHAHQDHIGCFLEFISKYRDEITIEGLYYTFPSLSLPEARFWKQSDNATMREFDDTVRRVLPHVPHYRLHTGQVFSLGELDFEVLFTHEDIYPERIGSFNDTSTVLRVKTAAQTLLFLGDLQEASCRKLEAMYGSYLKADLLQVAHHGFNGSTIETYELVSPTVALWPTPDYGFNGNRKRSVNAHLLNMDCVKEHLVAGLHGTRRLTLPYAVGSSVPIDLPKE